MIKTERGVTDRGPPHDIQNLPKNAKRLITLMAAFEVCAITRSFDQGRYAASLDQQNFPQVAAQFRKEKAGLIPASLGLISFIGAIILNGLDEKRRRRTDMNHINEALCFYGFSAKSEVLKSGSFRTNFSSQQKMMTGTIEVGTDTVTLSFESKNQRFTDSRGYVQTREEALKWIGLQLGIYPQPHIIIYN